MGSSPATSVVNKYSQVWDTPNVFVASASNLPQNACMNPTGTVLALAYYTGNASTTKYLKDPGKLISS